MSDRDHLVTVTFNGEIYNDDLRRAHPVAVAGALAMVTLQGAERSQCCGRSFHSGGSPTPSTCRVPRRLPIRLENSGLGTRHELRPRWPRRWLVDNGCLELKRGRGPGQGD